MFISHESGKFVYLRIIINYQLSIKKMSILIKDTTREERIEIVRRSLEDCDEGCESFMSNDVDEMYQPYIDGIKELREINAEQSFNYVVSEKEMPGRHGCGMGVR